MTKENFDKYEGLLFCKNCKRYVSKEHMYYKRVYSNGSVATCNVCEWFKRHPDKIHIEGFTDNEVNEFVYILFYKNDEFDYLDDIAKYFNKSLNEMVNLLKVLNLKNKKIKVRTVCDKCGKIFGCTISDYNHTKHHYCSHECYYKDKPRTSKKGKDSQYYNRILTNCTNCGKEIAVIPYNYKSKNKYGDNHNFCCNKCYWEYRSKYYVGEKSTMSSYVFSEEQRKRQAVQCLKNMKNMPTKNTSIQVIINDILDDMNINYEREHIIKYYSIDTFLSDYNLGIEIMGDYWHSNPCIYNLNNRLINDVQYKDVGKDKKKRTYLRRYYNMELLNLWENDIKTNIELCKSLIIYFIQKDGIIENNNSFNWTLDKDGNLQLKEIIVMPYFELDKRYAQNIHKKVS